MHEYTTDTIAMEWVETTGRTVEEALDAALDELGVDEAEVEYQVIEQPRGGLLGRLGGSEARVRARVKPLSREKPGERQRHHRRSGSGRGRASGVDTDADADTDEPTTRSEERAAVASHTAGESNDERGASGTATGTGRSRRRRRSRGHGSSGALAADATRSGGGKAKNGQAENEGAPVETTEPEVSIEEQMAVAESFTRGLVDAFELGAHVRGVIVDDGIVVDVTGDGLGLLVGPRGATLSAIEELVRTVVQRQTDGHGVRINVDVAGYRAKRREALEEFTRNIATKVLETRRPQQLEPMSASDRKVVHDVIAEIDGVATESQGEEPRRRVVVIPQGEAFGGDAS